MPRQLPWMNKGAGTQPKTKKAPPKKKSVASDLDDDDFFDGTILATSSRSKERRESDDDLPELPTDPSTPRTKTKRKDVFRKEREDSSSPPPKGDLERPQTEFMQKGVSKFDLRDDEWMMVEDEFLETAKLFTRHLHIAEYERLKETIEQKKKEAEFVRPVIAGAKMSVDGAFREKVKAQEKKQRRAFRDVFASQDDEDDTASTRASFSNVGLSFASTSRSTTTPSRWAPDSFTAKDPDSDDLDAPRPAKSVSRAKTNPVSTFQSSTASNSTPSRLGKPIASPVFAKPALPPSAAKPRVSKASRATPFDMLDEYTPRKPHSTTKPSIEPSTPRASYPSKSSLLSSSPTKSSFVSTTSPTKIKVERSANLLDDWGTSGLNKETAERIAKRKADREKDEKDKERAKRKAVKSEEIPTFLF